jgi:hypothetical protein
MCKWEQSQGQKRKGTTCLFRTSDVLKGSQLVTLIRAILIKRYVQEMKESDREKSGMNGRDQRQVPAYVVGRDDTNTKRRNSQPTQNKQYPMWQSACGLEEDCNAQDYVSSVGGYCCSFME